MNRRKQEEKEWKEIIEADKITGHFAKDGHIHKGHLCLCSRCGPDVTDVATEMSEEEIDKYNRMFDKRSKEWDNK